MSDNITLPREVVQEAVKALEFAERNHDGEQSLYTTEIAALRKALAAEQPKPSGYAYRYADGVLRLNDGSQFNGGWPVEAVPYWFAPPTAAPSEDIDALRQELAAVLSDWNSLVRASGSRTNGGAVGHVAALRRDAERYRYLRNRDPKEVFGKSGEAAGVWIDWEDDMAGLQLLTGDDADAAIDAAMGDKT
jgi:hypothetical protein